MANGVSPGYPDSGRLTISQQNQSLKFVPAIRRTSFWLCLGLTRPPKLKWLPIWPDDSGPAVPVPFPAPLFHGVDVDIGGAELHQLHAGGGDETSVGGAAGGNVGLPFQGLSDGAGQLPVSGDQRALEVESLKVGARDNKGARYFSIPALFRSE